MGASTARSEKIRSGMSAAIPPFSLHLETVTVIFGAHTSERLDVHLAEIEPAHLLVVHGATGEPVARRLIDAFGPSRADAFHDIAQHVPAGLAGVAVREARARGADTVVAIGGGSAIGFAKIIARDTGARIVAVPTTYSGSEMTPMWGITSGSSKTTGRDPRVMPRLVVYDPLLSLTLPAQSSAASGMNAIAHAVDALYATDASPLLTTMATESIRLLATALRRIAAQPNDAEARTDACYGAHLAGMALGTTTMALHHRICHVLGGRFNLPHAETHAVILPHAVAYNEPGARAADAHIAAALHVDRAAPGLWELERELQLPESLGELGLNAGDIRQAADDIVATPVRNPVAVTMPGVLRLLETALEGRPPRA